MNIICYILIKFEKIRRGMLVKLKYVRGFNQKYIALYTLLSKHFDNFEELVLYYIVVVICNTAKHCLPNWFISLVINN